MPRRRRSPQTTPTRRAVRIRIAAASAAIAVMMGSLVTAHAVVPTAEAEGLEQIAGIPIPATTHLNFLRRRVDGRERLFAILGSTAGAPSPGHPGGGLNIVDITDPRAPVFTLNVPCIATSGNLDVAVVDVAHTVGGVAYDTFLAVGSNSALGCVIGGAYTGGVAVVGLRATPAPGDAITADVLGSPFLLPSGGAYRWRTSPAAHTVVVHPTRPVVYAANQVIGTTSPSVTVMDFASWPPVAHDAALPPTGIGAHDITFSPDGARAYASAINVSMVLDTAGADLDAPQPVSVFTAPNLRVHHEATLHPDGRHLFVVDESVATGSGSVGVCPGGGVHVMDLGDDGALEATPIPVAQFYAEDASVPAAGGGVLSMACTAHEFSFPSSGRWMPIGWYGAGVRIFDLTSLGQPVPVISEIAHFAPAGTEVWAAKVDPDDERMIVVSDMRYGLRILELTIPTP